MSERPIKMDGDVKLIAVHFPTNSCGAIIDGVKVDCHFRLSGIGCGCPYPGIPVGRGAWLPEAVALPLLLTREVT